MGPSRKKRASAQFGPSRPAGVQLFAVQTMVPVRSSQISKAVDCVPASPRRQESPALALYFPPPGEENSGETGAPAARGANRDVLLPFSEPLRSKVARWAKRGITKWEQDGSGAAIASAIRKMARHYSGGRLIVPDRYDRWIARNEPDDRALGRQVRMRFPMEPVVSIVTPVYNTPLAFLEAMVQSVLAQTYQNWELCLADGGSDDQRLR